MRRVLLPAALPALLTGLRAQPGVDVHVAAELIAATRGLCYRWPTAARPAAPTSCRRRSCCWKRTEGGGAVEGLPQVELPTAGGGRRVLCPTEVMIDDRRNGEPARNGLVALVSRANSDIAVFMHTPSLQRPFEYDDAEATENAAWPLS